MVRIQWNLCAISALVLGSLAGISQERAQNFLSDDPIQQVPEVAAVRNISTQSINDIYDFAVNSAQYKAPKTVTVSRAVNTLGEVPDSSWYTNRDLRSTSVEDIRRGPRRHGEPQPPFTVVAAKSEGVTPGFRIKDGRGLLYFIKVDPPTNPEMATGADVMAALLLYAAGYNVPENYIVMAPKEAFVLSKNATITAASGQKHAMTKADLQHILDAVPAHKNGEIRVMASLALSGKVVGPFRYKGVRSDDPNDLEPHERRRDLRGLNVIFAWLNHTDAKGENSLDTIVGEGESARVRHNLLDFGDSFGSDSNVAKYPQHGSEYYLPLNKEQWKRGYTFGIATQPWERVKYPHELGAVGNFTAMAFDPLAWKPNYPNPAFLAMTPVDGYWAAKKVMAFTNDQIEGAVSEARFSDSRVASYIARALEQRRDAIGRAYFAQVLPLEEFALENGKIQYRDLGVNYGLWSKREYRISWFKFGDDSASQRALDSSDGDALPNEVADAAEGTYLVCKVELSKGDERSTTVYFRRETEAWKLVGIDRVARHP